MNGFSSVFTLFAALMIVLFTYLSSRAQTSLWLKCHRRESCLRMQHHITMGKSHCR